MSVITVWKFAKALVEAGILTQDQVNRTTRIVIDADPNNGAVVIYVQQYADERFLKVAQTLAGIEVTAVQSDSNFVQRHWCDNAEPHLVPQDCIVNPSPVNWPITTTEELGKFLGGKRGEEETTSEAAADPEEPTGLG